MFDASSLYFTSGNLVILGCTDGNLLVYDAIHHSLDCQTKCSFYPSLIRVHPDQALIVTASEKGLLQCFDIALNPIKLTFSHEESLGSAILDLSQYFRPQMSLVDASFCHRGQDLMELSNMMEQCHLATMANNYLTVRFHVRTSTIS